MRIIDAIVYVAGTLLACCGGYVLGRLKGWFLGMHHAKVLYDASLDEACVAQLHWERRCSREHSVN